MRRRVLHVPAEDLREGDVVSFTVLDTEFGTYHETTVKESRLGEDHDGSWYIVFENERFTRFCSPSTQFTLLQEL